MFVTFSGQMVAHLTVFKNLCKYSRTQNPTLASYITAFFCRYNVVLTVGTYLVPISIVSFAYIKTGRNLWGSKVFGEATAQQLDMIRSKRKVFTHGKHFLKLSYPKASTLFHRKIVKMLIMVVAIFSLCWLPYHIFFLVSWLYRPINEWRHIQEVYLAIYWLAMSSSMYNPFIYCWMNSKY